MLTVTVHVPATTANLGPGFDCLGLALDIWSQVRFSVGDPGIRVTTTGFGSGSLPGDKTNLIARAFLAVCQQTGRGVPPGLQIDCHNRFPTGSGLGSSAAAVLAGVMGANAWLGDPLPEGEILSLATRLEGHPDNVAPALKGGLTISINEQDSVITRKVDLPPFWAGVVVPDFHLATRAARGALPKRVPMADAVYNLGRVPLVVEALRAGDMDLLNKVMGDRLHQPYRLKLIPGGPEAFEAARRSGAPGVALSGAGPGVVAFAREKKIAQEAVRSMVGAFTCAGLESWSQVTQVSPRGARVETSPWPHFQDDKA